MAQPCKVSAPAKLVVIGEYVVTAGEAAVVLAVDPPRARASLGRASQQVAPEIQAALTVAAKALNTNAVSVRIDTEGFRHNEVKLGLGSSAAGAVAAVGLLMAEQGHDLAETATRQQLHAFAFEGHRAVAPSGSGIDIAAAVWGGALVFHAAPKCEAVDWPSAWRVRLAFTGHAARTSDFLYRFTEFRQSSPGQYLPIHQRLRDATQSFIGALRRGAAADAFAQISTFEQGLVQLGDALSMPIVTPELARISFLAREVGGAAKPSGAGGGDIAVALFGDHDAALQFDIACQNSGFLVWEPQLNAEGVRLDQDAVH